MADLLERAYNPDVLNCLANLSNDEVFTPPALANQVLDLLPDEIWRDPGVRILDPCCKSGVFLREACKRLIRGLEPAYPDLQERVDHIMHEQLFGIAITEMTGMMSRRSLYCSKHAGGRFSVSAFAADEGNIRFRELEHTWVGGRCRFCGASEKEYRRSSELESHAYEFIHTVDPEEIFDMRFDVIVGNPPYQLNDGGGNGSSATPIYQHFVSQAQKLNPRYLSMIVPARWFTGGKGLDSFRKSMLDDRRLRKLVSYQDSRECFDGVDIAGGVCYFLWDRDNEGDCEIINHEDGTESISTRPLNEYPVFIASNSAIGIIRKVQAHAKSFMDVTVRPRQPFGIASDLPDEHGNLGYRWRGGLDSIEAGAVTRGFEMVDKWKVIVSKASAEHAGQADKNGQRKILTVVEVLPPRTVCSETYLVVDAFDKESDARKLVDYLKSRFVRFLIWQATPTQNITKNCFIFVPSPDLSQSVRDEDLYRFYGLSAADAALIESKIKEFPERTTDARR